MKKLLKTLLILFSCNLYADYATSDTVKVSYMYNLSKAINSSSFRYCVNDNMLFSKFMEVDRNIIVLRDNNSSCNVTFNYVNDFAITFTDNEYDKENYMFFLKEENNRVLLYRNSSKTSNLNIPDRISNSIINY